VIPAVVAIRVSFVAAVTRVGIDLIPALGTRDNTLAKTALAVIPVVQLGITGAVSFNVLVATRAEAEMLVDTSFTIKLSNDLRHFDPLKNSAAVGARRRSGILRFLRNLKGCSHGTSPFVRKKEGGKKTALPAPLFGFKNFKRSLKTLSGQIFQRPLSSQELRRVISSCIASKALIVRPKQSLLRKRLSFPSAW